MSCRSRVAERWQVGYASGDAAGGYVFSDMCVLVLLYTIERDVAAVLDCARLLLLFSFC